MGTLLLMPLRKAVVIDNLPDLTLTLEAGANVAPADIVFPVDATTPPVTVTVPPVTVGGVVIPPEMVPAGYMRDTNGQVYAFPPRVVSEWSRDAGQRVSDHLAQLMGLSRRGYGIAVAFSQQANHEDANGNSAVSQGAGWNNPLNLTAPNATYWQNQSGIYLGRFAKFLELDDGAAACALNYYNGPEYVDVRTAFRADDPIALSDAIQASPWDADHYGGNLSSEVRVALGI